MVSLLNVADDGVLSPNTESAIGQKFLPRSEYTPGGGGGGESLPAYVSGARAHGWTAPMYNAGAASISLIRGMIAAVDLAAITCEIVMFGDSKLEGYNTGGSGVRWRYGWPGLLRALLGGVEGTVLAFPAGIDARWDTNMVQGFSSVPGLIKDGATTPSATFTFDTPHTGGSFGVHSAAGGVVTVAVDDGVEQSFTVPAGNGFKLITPTVTGEGTHTYVIAGAALDHLYGFRPTYAGAKLKITNLGRSGATAASWLPGASATQTGHWDGLLAMTEADAVIGALGTNQPGNNGPANAADLTTLWAAVAALALPALIVTPGGLDLTGSESWLEQYRAQFDAADAHDLPLIDFASVIGTGADAQARGLMADTVHENRKGFAYEAAAVQAAIGASRA